MPWSTKTSLLLLGLFLVGCGADTPSLDFQISLSSAGLSLPSGGEVSVELSVQRQSGHKLTLSLGLVRSDDRVVPGLSITPDTIAGNEDRKRLVIRATQGVAPGTYRLKLRASDEQGRVRVADLELTVSPPPPLLPPPADFLLGLSPSSLSIVQGGSATLTLTLTPQNGFTGTVNLSLAGAPSGLSLSPSSLSVGGSPLTQTLTLSASGTVPTGPHALSLVAQSGSLIKTSPLSLQVAGAVVWQQLFSNSNQSENEAFYGLALAPGGDILVGGHTETIWSGGQARSLLSRYGSSGNLLWQKKIDPGVDGGGNFNRAYGVGVDALENAYLAGMVTWDICDTGSLGDPCSTQNVSGASDAFVRKYDSSGTPLWTRLIGTPQNDEAYGLAVVDTGGSDDGVYVVGYTTNASNEQDMFVARYDLNGAPQWYVNPSLPGHQAGVGVAVAGGRVYVVGYTSESALPAPTDAALWVFGTSGTPLSFQSWGDTGTFEVAWGVAVGAGKVAVAGMQQVPPPPPGVPNANPSLPPYYEGQGRAFVRLYNPGASPVLQWEQLLGQPSPSGVTFFRAVALDAGAVVAVGNTREALQPGSPPPANDDLVVAVYSLSGNLLWLRQMKASPGNGHTARAVALGPSRIVVAGEFSYEFPPGSSTYPSDAFLLVLNR